MSLQQGQSVVLSAANDLGEIGRLAELVDSFCADNGLGEAVAHAFNLSIDELLTNTISYGYDDTETHQITVTLTAFGDRMTATIQDDARAFDPTQSETPDIEADLDDRPIGGLGLFFVREMMDEISYERVGAFNRITLTKRVGA